MGEQGIERTDVLVVGAGASAVLAVTALRRCRPGPPLRVTVVGDQHRPGRGVAYSTPDTAHRMNVPTHRSSALSDDPDHLVRWVQAERPEALVDEDEARTAHLPRTTYGDYLEAVLSGAADPTCASGDPVDLTVTDGRVVHLTPTPDGWAATLRDGRTLTAPSVLLAVGPPPTPAPLALPDDPRVVADPWSADLATRLARARHVVAIGSGMTMVDVALTATALGATVTAVSRHGLLPRPHPHRRLPPSRPVDPPDGPLTAAQVRRLVVEQTRREPNGWEAAIDATRSCADRLWSALPPAEQGRVLRRGFGWWMVHRHRTCPQVAARLDALLDEGRVRIERGTVTAVVADRNGVGAVCRHRGAEVVHRGDVVVACTGPRSDVATTTDPLLRGLLDDGWATVGPHALGLAVDACGILVPSRPDLTRPLHVIGPLRLGSQIETTAIPELRDQAAALAPLLRAAAGR